MISEFAGAVKLARGAAKSSSMAAALLLITSASAAAGAPALAGQTAASFPSDTLAIGAPIVGQTAPSFKAETLDGKSISLSDFKGDVVVVNLWATWCAPCREEMPLLDAYARAHAGEGLRIVGVTMDRGELPGGIIQKIQDVLSFPLLKNFRGPYAPIHRAVPTNFVIDRNGNLRIADAHGFTMDSLNKTLGPLLAERAPAPVPQASAPKNVQANADGQSSSPATPTKLAAASER